MTESSAIHLVGVAIPTLRVLRSAVMGLTTPDAAVNALRDAGFAGGGAVHAAFERWLAESSSAGFAADDEPVLPADVGSLSVDQFAEHTARFFRDAGWGELTLSQDESEGIAIVDIVNCWEAAGGEAANQGCHITTGLLAAFFGRVAGYPVAVLEAECSDGGESPCRFLMGNIDVMNDKWETMQ